MGKKQFNTRINAILISIAALIIVSTLWYSRALFQKVAEDERLRVRNWAAATERQNTLFNYVKTFFSNLESEERKYATSWCYAYERLLSNTTKPSEYHYYIKVITENKNIPYVLVDKDFRIIDDSDPNIDKAKTPFLTENLQISYSENPPIEMNIDGEIVYYFYYKPSALFQDLRSLLNSLSNSFIGEVLENPISVPVIITDSTRSKILYHGNISTAQIQDIPLRDLLHQMEHENAPIPIMGLDNTVNYIFYESSPLLTNLRYIPFALLLSLAVLITAIILVYGLSRNAEQNQVWWGMSKETAHQLGTPISSLLAWAEYYKLKREEPISLEDLDEIEKDLIRLQTITQRFSKIGSVPELKSENIVQMCYRAVNYIQARISKNISFHIEPSAKEVILLPLNAPLFEWVIENICHNAANAIGEKGGSVNIFISQNEKQVVIDIQDTGKGIPKSAYKKVFRPGFTTKKRGWGLGLTLSRRIVNQYHKGKIFVKQSIIGQGTTFRILLNK